MKFFTFNLTVLLQLSLGNSNNNNIYPTVIARAQDSIVNQIELPIAAPEKDTSFLMPVDSIYTITGRGTVATGRIARGTIQTGDAIEIIGLQNRVLSSTVTGVEISSIMGEKGIAGDSVGLLLRGIERFDIRRGMVICAPKSISVHTKFNCKAYILSREQGGRHTPFFNNYKPQFLILTADVIGEVELPPGTEMVMPGDSVNMTVKLFFPVALEKNFRITIREGKQTIGSGLVTEIIR